MQRFYATILISAAVSIMHIQPGESNVNTNAQANDLNFKAKPNSMCNPI